MEKRRSFDALTGLKGIFILLIVFFHTLPQTPLIDRIPLTSFIHIYGGTLGNYMFFMLSGFLISNGYRERIRTGEISFGAFLMRRLHKLYPLYILSNLVMLVGEIVQYGPSAIDLKKIILTVLLQSGGGLETTHPYNGPTWFLSALFVCYIAYFFIAFYAKNQTCYCCMIGFGIIWGYTLAIAGWTPPLCFGQNGESFLNFFLGCALAMVFPRLDKKTWKWLQPAAVLVLAVSGFLLLCYGVEVIAGDSKVAFAFLICPLVICLAVGENPISWFLQRKPVLYWGKISVSIFFWHYVIYDIFEFVYRTATGGAQIRGPQYVVYLALTILLSILSHHFLEGGKSREARRI